MCYGGHSAGYNPNETPPQTRQAALESDTFTRCNREVDRRQPAQRPNLHRNPTDVERRSKSNTRAGRPCGDNAGCRSAGHLIPTEAYSHAARNLSHVLAIRVTLCHRRVKASYGVLHKRFRGNARSASCRRCRTRASGRQPFASAQQSAPQHCRRLHRCWLH